MPQVCMCAFRTIFFFTKTEKRPMSQLTSLCVISHFFGIRNTVQRISFLCPSDVVGNRHEDEPIFKFFRICSAICHLYMNFFKNFHCSVSWENIPLTLKWFSIDSKQISVFIRFLKILKLCFPLYRGFLDAYASFPDKERKLNKLVPLDLIQRVNCHSKVETCLVSCFWFKISFCVMLTMS